MSADLKPTASHPATPKPNDLDDVTRELIRGKARQLVRKVGFSPSDADDLAQDIGLHVWRRLGKFDRSKAEQAVFVRMLVAHATSTVLRDRKRQARRASPALEQALRNGETLAESVDPKSLGWEGNAALAIDVPALLAALPPNLRRLAVLLKTHKLATAARQLGISRALAYKRLAELREAFQGAGLGNFVDNRQTLRERSE